MYILGVVPDYSVLHVSYMACIIDVSAVATREGVHGDGAEGLGQSQSGTKRAR
jgi:hypothetical protein